MRRRSEFRSGFSFETLGVECLDHSSSSTHLVQERSWLHGELFEEFPTFEYDFPGYPAFEDESITAIGASEYFSKPAVY